MIKLKKIARMPREISRATESNVPTSTTANVVQTRAATHTNSHISEHLNRDVRPFQDNIRTPMCSGIKNATGTIPAAHV